MLKVLSQPFDQVPDAQRKQRQQNSATGHTEGLPQLDRCKLIREPFAVVAVHDRPFAELNSFLRDARAVGPDAIQQFVHEHLGSAGTTLVIAGKLKDFRKALGTAYKNAEIIPQSELDLDAPSLRGKR